MNGPVLPSTALAYTRYESLLIALASWGADQLPYEWSGALKHRACAQNVSQAGLVPDGGSRAFTAPISVDIG